MLQQHVLYIPGNTTEEIGAKLRELVTPLDDGSFNTIDHLHIVECRHFNNYEAVVVYSNHKS